MLQGEIRTLATNGRTIRMVIVSGDEYGQHSATRWVAPIRHAPDLPPVLVGLHDTDPLGGAVDLRGLTTVFPEELGQALGIITGHTMDRIRRAINDITAG